MKLEWMNEWMTVLSVYCLTAWISNIFDKWMCEWMDAFFIAWYYECTKVCMNKYLCELMNESMNYNVWFY